MQTQFDGNGTHGNFRTVFNANANDAESRFDWLETMLEFDSSGFSGNLDPEDTTLQEVLDKMDTLPVPDEQALTANFFTDEFNTADATQANLAAWFAEVSGTHSRAGNDHRFINSEGYLEQGSVDTLRYTFNPLSLQSEGVLAEPERTNRIAFSDTFENNKWAFSNSNVTRTDAATIGVENLPKCATLIENTVVDASHRLFWYDNTITQTLGSHYTFSIYLKSLGRDVRLIPSANMGLGTTDVTFSKNQATNGWNYEKLRDGMVRVWKTGTAPSAGVPNMQMILLNNGLDVYTGDGASGIGLEKAQYEEVDAEIDGPSTYIDNSGTTKNTRSADLFTFDPGVTKLFVIYGDGSQANLVTTATAYELAKSVKPYGWLSTAGYKGTSVAGKVLNVTLTQSDIIGLSREDAPVFKDLVLSSKIGFDSQGLLKTDGVTFQWTTSRTENANRAILIGHKPVQAGTVTNSVVIGNDAAKTSTTVSNSTVINDTAGALATTITNSEVVGNEAGNHQTSIASSVLMGNFAGVGALGDGDTSVESVAIGYTTARNKGMSKSVLIGSAAGDSTGGSFTRSVIVGANCAKSVTGDVSNLVLVGDQIEPPSSTTSNYMSLADVIKSDLSSNIVSITKQDGAGIATLLTETTSPATPAANSALLFLKDNGSGLMQLSVKMPDGVETILATSTS